MTKRILITGAAGFIGFHTAVALHKAGHFVVGLDNFNNYYSVSLKRLRAQILEKAGIRIIEEDICSTDVLKSLFEKEGFTHLIHLAAQAGVRYGQQNPMAYVHSNLEGFCSLLEICRIYPKTKLIFASSSSVYGLNKKIPFSENDPTDQPASLYAATKKSGELLAFSYHSLYGTPVAALRFFTVYGPFGRPDMAYFHFADSILKGKPLTLFNEGKMARDFTYIDDIVEAICKILDTEIGFEIFNLGNHHPETVLKLVSLLEKELNKKAIIQFASAQKEEVPITFADISKAEKRFGFSPKTSLEEGLHKFVNWFRQFSENRGE